MEGRRSRRSVTRHAILKKIREFTKSIIQDLSNGRSPLVILDRHHNYCTNNTGNCSDLHKSKQILVSFQRDCYARRTDVMLRVLLIVQKLLQENKHGSKRDIYYMHPSVFSEQVVVDRAINDICVLLKCSRHNLNVVSVGKGLVMGWLRFSESERKFDCLKRPSTGRGYPDVSTRRFLRLLIEELALPAYCLVDCDPYGFDILAIYRFGSMEMAYDAKLLSVPEIRWLGAFPSDSDKYLLPEQCLLPLTAEDKRKAEAILLRCYLQQEVPQWRLELEEMLQRGVKFEIEALSVSSLSFLSDEYIPSKIESGMHI